MDMASQYKVGKPVLEYLRILPRAKHDQQLYTMALTTIAKARDLDSAAGVLDLAKRHGITADKRLLTAFMKGVLHGKCVVLSDRLHMRLR